ncbi:MAG TPA: ATP-binding protein [Mucilaginibacter sp.]|jgi:signal transduction histidine kinase
MYFFFYLTAFFLVRRLQKALKFSPLYPKWRSIFSVSLGVSLAALIVGANYFDNPAKIFVADFLLIAYVVFADREPDFKVVNSFVRSNYPLIAVGLLAGLTQLILPDFYHKSASFFFDLAIIGAFVWTFARWATMKKNQEELSKISQQNKELDRLVAERTAELTKQKNELQETLVLLQTTQQQLIQSEKLASLGELTAGIAHEIQNPLNFVNNFSEVSVELIDEMEQELTNGDKDEAIAIAGDLKQNLEKIIHHGKRADGIVKGMLQHSRASNGIKELTNINTLADEYLRLAYHGLRAKEKSFNADLITHFDEKIPVVNVVPQDIGRVLLNLFTNAFYAVQQKEKLEIEGYKPAVTITTYTKKGSLLISVKDNGIGIPDDIKDKIMQPFFTTKPTGEGTGLGLSLTYDMVVKGHGGNITVDTKEGEFTEFIISLPIVEK